MCIPEEDNSSVGFLFASLISLVYFMRRRSWNVRPGNPRTSTSGPSIPQISAMFPICFRIRFILVNLFMFL